MKLSGNHFSVLSDLSIVREKIQEELLLGRIAGPFNDPPFKPMFISPLSLIPKRDQPGKYRIIHNLSFPPGHSVNDGIPHKYSAVQYQNLLEAVSLIKQRGRGCLIAKADIMDAYRNIPIHPSSYPLLGFTLDSKFHYDRHLPQGLSSSCSIFESISSTLQWILQNNVSHIIDDFMFFG